MQAAGESTGKTCDQWMKAGEACCCKRLVKADKTCDQWMKAGEACC